MAAEDAIVHGIVDAEGREVRGMAGFKAYHATMRAAFPDIRIEILDQLTEGDRIAMRCSVEGTHQGRGPDLDLEPTGRRIAITGIWIARVEGGKIVEAWNNFDFLTLYQQLGLSLR